MFKIRKRKLKGGKKQTVYDKLNIKHIDILDAKLKRYTSLYTIKNKIVKRLTLINSLDTKINNNAVLVITIILAVVNIIVMLMLIPIFKNLLIVILITTILTLLEYFVSDLIIQMQLNKINKQFPIALQAYIDSYMTTGNIYNSFSSYVKMPIKIGKVFANLSRDINSGKDFDKIIQEFAIHMDYIWIYAFSELLLLSNDGSVGSISKDLIFLSEMVFDDIQKSEETKSQLIGNKIVFALLVFSTVFAIFFNISTNEIAKNLYINTTTGNLLITMLLVTILAGIIGSKLLDNI